MLSYTCAVFMLLCCKACAEGTESFCQVTIDQRNCTVQINVTLPIELVKARRPFQISDNLSIEIVSFEPYGEFYRCVADKDFDCEQANLTTTFSIRKRSDRCIQEVVLSADGERNISCAIHPQSVVDKEASSEDTGIVIGVICSCLVVVVAAVTLVCYLRKRNRRGRTRSKPDRNLC